MWTRRGPSPSIVFQEISMTCYNILTVAVVLTQVEVLWQVGHEPGLLLAPHGVGPVQLDLGLAGVGLAVLLGRTQ